MYSRVKKVKTGGKTYKYYQIVESRYKNGQSRQKVLLTLGRVDDFDPSFADELAATLSEFTSKTTVLSSLDDCHHLWSKEYGSVYVLEKLWNELNLTDIMGKYLKQHEYEFDVIAAIKAMVFNRAIDANSKRSAHEWMQEDVYLPETKDLQLHHLYRALDFLIEHKKGIEGKIYDNLKDLFNLDVTVVFYDCSLFDMYGETSQLVQYSRKSSPQVLLSFVLSRDGLPISHEVLPGNTSDINTVIKAMQKLKQRYPIGKCIFVGDRGMVSREKLNKLEDMGFDFIVGVKFNQWKEVKEDVLSTRGRYTKVADNLKVKETEVNGYRYIDKMQIREDKKLDGKYILYTSTDSKDLNREEIATTYKRLSNIERSFRSLKSLHDLEPVFHYADRRIKAHVFLCILAHLLERLMEKKFARENFNMTANRALKHLSRMKITKAKLKDKKF